MVKDYWETYSPVAELDSIRDALCLAAIEDWDVENTDVNFAFLNSDISEEIYVRQPQGFVQYGPNGDALVCKVLKSLYGRA